ncbi:MAG TPA: biosynthetic peptidoglycan transglycosylase [Geobacteraceae bacterium]
MKLKWFGYVVAGMMAIAVACLGAFLWSLPPVAGLADRATNLTIQVQDWQGRLHPFVVGPKNPYWTPLAASPRVLQWAVVLAEDGRFYEHGGVDFRAVREALRHDLATRSFARGASTITQQLAKNLFLTREKSLIRKVKEVALAWRLEHALTKGRILELYLNVIELGPLVYGIGHGAHYYFAKPASELTPRECAFLAAMLPGPQKAYNPYRNMARVLKRSDMILRLLRDQGVLSEQEFRQALAEQPNIGGLQKKVDESLTGRVRRFLDRAFHLFD